MEAVLPAHRTRAFRRKSRLAAGLGLVSLLGLAAGASADPAGQSAPRTSSEGGVVVKGVTVTAAMRQKPTGAPPPLEIFATPAKFEHIALSPDGGQIAYVTSYDGMRLLIAHRLADNTRRLVKLDGGDAISAISWADPDHVLVTASKSGLRGTCDAGDERAIGVNVGAANNAVENAVVAQAQNSTDPTNQASSIPVTTLLELQTSAHSHPCVYYGVRSQSAVTSVDLSRQSGKGMGLHFGDYNYRPLGAPERLTIGGKSELAGPFLELRSKPMADEPAERVYLWSIDPKTGVGRLFDDHGGDLERRRYYVDDWMLDRRGGFLARSVYDFEARRYTIETRTGGKWKPVLTRQIVDKEHTFAPFLVGPGRADGSVVILDAKDEGGARRFHYYELGPGGAVSGPLEPEDAARDRPVFDPRNGRVSGFAESGAGETYVLNDPDLQAIYQHAQDAVPGESVRVVSTADDPRKVILYARGHEDPGAYYLVDFGTGENRSIGDDYPWIPTEWVAPQSQITYKAADGLEINALLTLPPKPQAKNLPLVVLPHDELGGHDSIGFYWLAQGLASRGYAVLQPQYRGSDGYGRAYREAGYGQLGRKMQSDLSDGVRQLAAQGLVDPRRVCILGIGWGGYAALTAAATEGSATWRCAGAINGVSDPDAYASWLKKRQVVADEDRITTLVADPTLSRGFTANPMSPQILASYAGAEGSAPSPRKLVDNVSIPILLVGSDGDLAAPPKQTAEMRDALLTHHKFVQFVEVKRADHEMTGKDARLATLTAVTDFLAKYDPAD